MVKKSIGLALASMIVLSSIHVSYASSINNYQSGTEVVYQAANEEAWTLTVPARLSSNSEGTVTLTGAWSSEKTINVTAPEIVVLTNELNSSNKKELGITFPGISAKGSDITTQTFTEMVKVSEITDALFGKWSGIFYYNLNIETGSREPLYIYPDTENAKMFDTTFNRDTITIAANDKFFETYRDEYGSDEGVLNGFKEMDIQVQYAEWGSNKHINLDAIKDDDKAAFTFPSMRDGIYDLRIGPVYIVLLVAPDMLPDNAADFNKTYVPYQYTDDVADEIPETITIAQNGDMTYTIHGNTYQDRCMLVDELIVPKNMFATELSYIQYYPSENGTLIILCKNGEPVASYVTDACNPGIQFETRYVVTESEDEEQLGCYIIFHRDGTFDMYYRTGDLEGAVTKAWIYTYLPNEISKFGEIQNGGKTIVSNFGYTLTLEESNKQ